MRSENEDQCLVLRSKPEDTTRDFHKKSKLSYTREFLVSFAKLDTCKNFPVGFDSSMLRELDDQSTSVLHSYHDSDACRFQSTLLSHCSRRNPERGLLGSGAFAGVLRGIAETSVSVVQGSGFHLLNRSSEPYRHPHLCKVKYYSGRESKDHYNDETFGPPDNLSQDREKEEKMRRVFIEQPSLLRFIRIDEKEQEMGTQHKQKIICDDHTENLNPDIAVVLEDCGVDKKVAIKNSRSKHCDVREDHFENPLACSSDLTHRFVEGDKTPGEQKVIEYHPEKFSFGTNGSGHNLMKSAPTPVTKETSTEIYGRCNPEVFSYECLEEPFQSESNGHYSTQHHSPNGRSSYDLEDSQSSCSFYDAASQHFLSLLHKGAGLTDLAESAKLNTWSLDRSYVPETEIDNYNQLTKPGRVRINNVEKNLHGPISRTLRRDSQSTVLTGTLKDLTGRFKWDDSVMSPVPLPVGDNCIIPLKVNESGSIGDVEGIVVSSFLKQTCGSKRNSLQAEVGLGLQGGPESKHGSLSSFDELDICLPDEDSLITVADYIFPQDSVVGTSSAAVNTFGRLSDCGAAVGVNRFDLAGLETPTSFHGSHDLTSLETYFNNLHMQQSNPQLHHSQPKPAKAWASQKGSRTKPRDLESYDYSKQNNIQSLQHLPKNMHLTPFQRLRAAAIGFDHSGNHQSLQELPVPGHFRDPQQLYGLPRAAFPQYASDEMACYRPDQNGMLNSFPEF